ncbi:MAG: hypothetical protein PHZ02_00980 [Desulfocapsaceae bacterium]|nr:hypothetical protein [Desulfocapsaceae bacterium]
MADATAVSSYWTMNKLSTTDFFIVASETQSRACTFKLELIGRLVWIVTSSAFALCNRLMDNRAVV